MANLYDINQQIIDTIEYGCDLETGEMLEDNELTNKVNEIEMVLNDKMENIACYIKNLKADVDAFKTEKDNLAKRQKSTENKIAWLEKYLSNFMQYNEIPKFETSKCKVSFRKSTSVQITDQDKVPKEFIKTKTETNIDKTELKKYLKDHKCEGAELVENLNMQIK